MLCFALFEVDYRTKKASLAEILFERENVQPIGDIEGVVPDPPSIANETPHPIPNPNIAPMNVSTPSSVSSEDADSWNAPPPINKGPSIDLELGLPVVYLPPVSYDPAVDSIDPSPSTSFNEIDDSSSSQDTKHITHAVHPTRISDVSGIKSSNQSVSWADYKRSSDSSVKFIDSLDYEPSTEASTQNKLKPLYSDSSSSSHAQDSVIKNAAGTYHMGSEYSSDEMSVLPLPSYSSTSTPVAANSRKQSSHILTHPPKHTPHQPIHQNHSSNSSNTSVFARPPVRYDSGISSLGSEELSMSSINPLSTDSS